MESMCYWLNPDDEHQSYYVHLHPLSTINNTRTADVEVKEEGRRKRRRKSNGYIPNDREQKANELHKEILPGLVKALENFEVWKSSKPCILTTPSCWISPQSSEEVGRNKKPVLGDPSTGTVSWTALEKMKAVVKPKFHQRGEDGKDWVQDLFKTLHQNEDKVEKLCFAHESQVVFPRQSSFLMSDISQLPDLVDVLKKDGLYDLLLVDLPWENKSVHRSQKYQTIPNQQFLKLPIPSLMNPDLSFACFWLTNRIKLTEYFHDVLLPAWDLQVLTTWYWIKVDAAGKVASRIEANHRRPYEKLVITTKKDLVMKNDLGDIAKELFVVSPCQEHSRKPPLSRLFHQVLWKESVQRRCLEMFARELIPEWTSWGNEVLHFQDLNQYSLCNS